MKKVNVETMLKLSDDFNATERASAKLPKNIVPRNSANPVRNTL